MLWILRVLVTFSTTLIALLTPTQGPAPLRKTADNHLSQRANPDPCCAHPQLQRSQQSISKACRWIECWAQLRPPSTSGVWGKLIRKIGNRAYDVCTAVELGWCRRIDAA
jgi:hypothetical protein